MPSLGKEVSLEHILIVQNKDATYTTVTSKGFWSQQEEAPMDQMEDNLTIKRTSETQTHQISITETYQMFKFMIEIHYISVYSTHTIYFASLETVSFRKINTAQENVSSHQLNNNNKKFKWSETIWDYSKCTYTYV
jgi:hypothetical protein